MSVELELEEDVLDATYEIDDTEVTGLEALAGVYGLAKREEQFQEFYASFQNAKFYMNNGSFREGSRRMQDALEDFVESANDYLGMNIEADEYGADLALVSGAQAAGTSEEVFERMAQNPDLSKEDMREIMEEARESL